MSLAYHLKGGPAARPIPTSFGQVMTFKAGMSQILKRFGSLFSRSMSLRNAVGSRTLVGVGAGLLGLRRQSG